MTKMILAGIISFIASVIGAVSGIGGGIIIRPVLDMASRLNVLQISFLSGCTVLAMTAIALGKSFAAGRAEIDMKYGTPLALGASAGGCIGKMIFSGFVAWFGDEKVVGLIQAIILLGIIAGTAIYMFIETKIKTLHIGSRMISTAIGLILGVQSAFLGIGGGPLNLVVLSYFFSMERKKASLNSLYIIFFSQIFSIVVNVAERTVPELHAGYLILMILGGAAGGIVGGSLYRRMTSDSINRMFIGVLFLLLMIDIRNIMTIL